MSHFNNSWVLQTIEPQVIHESFWCSGMFESMNFQGAKSKPLRDIDWVNKRVSPQL